MRQLVDAGVQPVALGRGIRSAHRVVEDRAALSLSAVLIEHEPAQAAVAAAVQRARLMGRRVDQPDRPLGAICPAREMTHHRCVQLRVAPRRVGSGLGRVDECGRVSDHPDAGVGEGVDVAENASWPSRWQRARVVGIDLRDAALHRLFELDGPKRR